ncbi:valine--tRNA ligase [Pseudaestuariivita atlantica]|uniref:Valine--tRNA ligase n=1 Tax=Pseudaestuariivita atlantica TaxID=1317121 RepID=A0A0L1JRS1_9RHOB|nr:valine--tRNA ligase [Pseudaestuariivita atlantica]KNG94422.1 valine--tRNA ligase [Pseudaestuariivita atlantica]
MPIAKTFDAATAEPRITDAWERAGAFKAGKHVPNAETAMFSVMIPPPNVTGALHIGHAFNNTLQDILVRWHRMRGFDTLWQPGTDHAGIATQMVTEREMAANGEPTRAEMGREAFLARVWQQKVKSRGTIKAQLDRLGASCDWSREAFTMSGGPGAPEGEDGNFHDAVIKVFVDMYGKGLIYRGKRLVNWDPHFETAISDLEVENVETPGHMWHFKYPLAGGATYEYVEKDEDGNVTLRETRDYISIATTRPETMLGDGAVAVHPGDTRYAPIVGQLCEIPVGPKEHRRLIPIITDDYPDPDFGSGAVKITGAHDFNDYAVAKRGNIPCYRLMDTKGAMRADGAPYAEAAGVAMAVAKGERTLTEAETDTINLVPDDLRGLDRFEARDRVVEQITSEGLAVMTTADDPRLGSGTKKPAPAPEPGPLAEGNQEVPGQARDAEDMVPLVEAKPIMQPFGDRSKVVIEPMLTDQWFVDTDKIVGPALDAVKDGTVRILPESGERTYYHWLENIEPWCISRQLWWGHQIPVWYGLNLVRGGFRDDEGDGALDLAEMGRWLLAQEAPTEAEPHHCASDFDGVAMRFAGDIADLPTPLNHARIVECADRSEAMTRLAESLAEYEMTQDPTRLVYPVWRDPDVLDTWFSSGLWPIGTLGWPDDTPELKRYFPTSVLVTGQDILFFWVARMMMMQLAVVDQVPFHDVYLHGLVRDAKGKKMSKSVGNVVDPLEVIDQYGADALRFSSAAMAALGGVLKLDMKRIEGYRNFGTKIWNTAKLAEMNGVFDAAPHAQPAPTRAVNKWIIGELGRTREAVDAALAAYRFNDAANALYAFFWGMVCDRYNEFAKPLFNDPEARAETQATMGWVLDQSLILMHPIMPFLTEELWGETATRDRMCAHAEWPTYGAELVDAAADAEISWVIAAIDGIRSVRAQMNVPAGAVLDVMSADIGDAARGYWERNAALIERLARVNALSSVDALPKGAVTVALPQATLGLPLADVIDVAAERARLEKSRGKLDKEINGLAGRLKNPKFAESAPEEVVAETQANLDARQEEATRIDEALARLAEMG